MNENHGQSEPSEPLREDTVSGESGSRSETDPAQGAVALAEAELKRAKEAYNCMADEAIRRLREVREAKIGDLCDEALEKVKRYPGPSIVVAAVLGFFLGRLFHR